ncbi:FtsK/SpoIIIE domain-containing protein [Bacillus cereus group sp. BfR-BA-01495]|uniref:FtsK/SpoIIIE domain-containing protein n=1 Tax=Bacillus cereus group sp. BfR-BA-01495 TaxID=2920363 RepID=UPI001F5943C8|nr:FtsK/SpoIIIE domain-containing protein [Bacillus cereus group sp. BfR-BA-01495]
MTFFAFYELQNKKKKIFLDWTKLPHALISGASGAGKTFASKYLLGSLVAQKPEIELYIVDYKGDTDFEPFEDFQNCYRYNEAKDGILNFLDRFHQRQSGADTTRTPIYLFIDEFASFLTVLDKKEAEDFKRRIAELLMLARSFNVHLIMALQRADSSYFVNGARDNFSIRLGLGRLSDESRRMLFPDMQKEDYEPLKRGEGYLQTDSSDIVKIYVPEYNMTLANSLIAKGLGKKKE